MLRCLRPGLALFFVVMALAACDSEYDLQTPQSAAGGDANSATTDDTDSSANPPANQTNDSESSATDNNDGTGMTPSDGGDADTSKDDDSDSQSRDPNAGEDGSQSSSGTGGAGGGSGGQGGMTDDTNTGDSDSGDSGTGDTGSSNAPSINDGEPEFAAINGNGCQTFPTPKNINDDLTSVAPADTDDGESRAQQVKHVFIIVFENKCFGRTFGPDSPAPYLRDTLTSKGQLLTRYYGIGHLSLTNYIAMVSGQAPNMQTQEDCQVYTDFVPGEGADLLDINGQAVGTGCVYPKSVKTVVDQLEQAGHTWKGYMEDMGNSAPAEPARCRHPALNTRDNTQSAEQGDQYAARHNPFVYFHSIIDDPARCKRHDVPLTQLPVDLDSASTTPDYVFISPNLCHDAHDKPCVDGRPGGLESADEFLKEWVPKILDSAAYQDNGLLVITFDEAESDENGVDARACCNELPGPNSPSPGVVGPGGGRTGTVLISPLIEPGTKNDTEYNHYALLRTIENIFGLEYLGYAGQPGLEAFGNDVFNAGS